MKKADVTMITQVVFNTSDDV